jgi:PRC-barrel domain protein
LPTNGGTLQSLRRLFRMSETDHLLAPDDLLPSDAAKVRASTILGAFEQAETDLVGKAVVLTNGKAGTVEHVWLDELHGLLISLRGHDGKWPVSTLKFAQK